MILDLPEYKKYLIAFSPEEFRLLYPIFKLAHTSSSQNNNFPYNVQSYPRSYYTGFYPLYSEPPTNYEYYGRKGKSYRLDVRELVPLWPLLPGTPNISSIIPIHYYIMKTEGTINTNKKKLFDEGRLVTVKNIHPEWYFSGNYFRTCREVRPEEKFTNNDGSEATVADWLAGGFLVRCPDQLPLLASLTADNYFVMLWAGQIDIEWLYSDIEPLAWLAFAVSMSHLTLAEIQKTNIENFFWSRGIEGKPYVEGETNDDFKQKSKEYILNNFAEIAKRIRAVNNNGPLIASEINKFKSESNQRLLNAQLTAEARINDAMREAELLVRDGTLRALEMNRQLQFEKESQLNQLTLLAIEIERELGKNV